MPDRRRAEGAAPVRAATVVALVLGRRPVVDRVAALRAVLPAAAQLGVERVEHLRVERTNLRRAQQRRDVVAHVAAVQGERVRRAVELVEVALQQLVDRRAGARVTPLRHLGHQARADSLRLALGVRAGRHDLAQIVPAVGHRVDPGVHHDTQGAAGQHLDAALRAPLTSGGGGACHTATLPHSHHV